MRTENLKVALLGGPDVDARIPLILSLRDAFTFTVIGSHPSRSENFAKHGIAYQSYFLDRGSNPFADLKTFWQLIVLIRKIKPDIIHTFDTKPCVWGRLAAWLNRVPVIIGTLPGLGSLYSRDDFRSRVVRGIYRPMQKLACYCSDLTIFQNSQDADQFIKDGIIDRKKTFILPGSGVETNLFDPLRFSVDQRQQVRKSLGLNDTHVIVTMISRLIRPKGVLEFSQSAQSVRGMYPQTVFLLIGPDDHDSVDALTADEREQIANAVIYLGSRNDIPELLSISDVFVLPTYYREGIPRVLLEASSMGLPLISTQLPGCTEVVKHSKNGFLISERDVASLVRAIEMLITDPSLRKQFGDVSRQRAITLFDLSIISAQTTDIYSRLS